MGNDKDTQKKGFIKVGKNLPFNPLLPLDSKNIIENKAIISLLMRIMKIYIDNSCQCNMDNHDFYRLSYLKLLYDKNMLKNDAPFKLSSVFEYYITQKNAFVAYRYFSLFAQYLTNHSDYDVPFRKKYACYYDLYKIHELTAQTVEEQLNIAILNYLLGDIVYSHFLCSKIIRYRADWFNLECGSKLLYYFVMTAALFNHDIDSEELLGYYDKLAKKNNLKQIDFYYIGLICDILGEYAPGPFFEKAPDVKYANICYQSICLCGNERNQSIVSLSPSHTTINIEESLWLQIDEYIHILECIRFIDIDYNPQYNFYSVFSIPENAKGEMGTITRKLNTLRANKERELFIESIDIDVANNEPQIQNQVTEMKNYLYTVDGDVRDRFDNLNRYVYKIEKNEISDNVANQIALTIKQYTFESEKPYILYIWYFYHTHKISFQDVTDLSMYLMFVSLRHTLETGKKGAISAAMALINVGINISDTVFILIMPLFNPTFWSAIKDIFNCLVERKGDDLMDLQKESEYKEFIRCMWLHINKLSKNKADVFTQREYIDKNFHAKLDQVDMFLNERNKAGGENR